MTRRVLWLAATAAVAIGALCALVAYEVGRSRGVSAAASLGRPAAPAEVTAAVRTSPVEEGTVSRTAVAYGSVVPSPDGLRSLGVPFECQVERVAVSEGQAVVRGAGLLWVTGSPDARLALAQARADALAAEATLKQVRQRHALGLADDAALAQAEGASQASAARLQSLESRHLDAPLGLTSPVDGTVAKLDYAAGAVVPAGAVLAEVADSRAAEVHLGVDPSDVKGLVAGAPVSLEAVDGAAGAPVAGRVRSVSASVNPATRMADVYVALPEGAALALGAYVRGTFAVASAKGLVVPYGAVLPDGDRSVLFTVSGGRAVRHDVRVTAEDGEKAAVEGAGLKAGDAAVVSGNYELEDGMAVRVETGP